MKNINEKEYSLLVKQHNAKWKFLSKVSDTFRAIYDAPEQRYFLDIPENIEYEIEDKKWEKFENDVESVLKYKGYNFINLQRKIASSDNKNWVKIGRLLTKFNLPKIVDKWKKYCNQYIDKDEKTQICISLNPLDVLSGSYERKWKSCLNPLEWNSNYSYLSSKILDKKYYTFVAYLITKGDTNIENPLGRIYIHGFIEDDSSEYTRKTHKLNDHISFVRYNENKRFPKLLFDLDSTYGVFPFRNFLLNFIFELNKELVTIYKSRQTSRFICRGYYNNSLKASKVLTQFIKNVDLTQVNKDNTKKKYKGGIDSALWGDYKVRFYDDRKIYDNAVNKSAYVIDKIKNNDKVTKDKFISTWKKLKLYQKIRLLEIKPNLNLSYYVDDSADEETRFLLNNNKLFIQKQIEKQKQDLQNKEKEIKELESKLKNWNRN